MRALITCGEKVPVVCPIYVLPPLPCWPRVTGVTLLGDAAHLMGPFAGGGQPRAARRPRAWPRARGPEETGILGEGSAVSGAVAALEENMCAMAGPRNVQVAQAKRPHGA